MYTWLLVSRTVQPAGFTVLFPPFFSTTYSRLSWEFACVSEPDGS